MELLVTTAITALVSSLVGALVGALVSKVKTVRIQAEEAEAEAEELKSMIAQNTVLTCRMAIYDEHFSVDEKLEAYKIYRDRGGNHQTKKYMDKLVGGDVDEYLEKHAI
ncbi:MAG: hypothetical protein IJG82_07690 [Atopobiaceae bacterium]|nr:hypothetical protein [Atopobiaceae bacterium]